MLKVFDYPRTIFVALTLCFLLYSFKVYFSPYQTNATIAGGKSLWQKNNCHTCHQLFGLGGYLGPDLTNVVQKQGYTDDIIKNIIRYGRFQMPAYKFTEQEMDEIITFLRAVNNFGSAAPADYQSTYWGTTYRK